AAPPAQRGVVADVGPVEDAQLAMLELDYAVLLGLAARAGGVAQARPVWSEVVLAHRAAHLQWPRVETQVAAHHTDAVIAMAGEVVERRVHASEQPGRDQFEFNLLQWAPVELLGHLNGKPALLGSVDNGIGLAQLMCDWGLQ